MCAICASIHAMWTDVDIDDDDDDKRAVDLNQAPNYCLINWSACLEPTTMVTKTGKKIVPNSCCPMAINSND